MDGVPRKFVHVSNLICRCYSPVELEVATFWAVIGGEVDLGRHSDICVAHNRLYGLTPLATPCDTGDFNVNGAVLWKISLRIGLGKHKFLSVFGTNLELSCFVIHGFEEQLGSLNIFVCLPLVSPWETVRVPFWSQSAIEFGRQGLLAINRTFRLDYCDDRGDKHPGWSHKNLALFFALLESFYSNHCDFFDFASNE